PRRLLARAEIAHGMRGSETRFLLLSAGAPIHHLACRQRRCMQAAIANRNVRGCNRGLAKFMISSPRDASGEPVACACACGQSARASRRTAWLDIRARAQCDTAAAPPTQMSACRGLVRDTI